MHPDQTRVYPRAMNMRALLTDFDVPLDRRRYLAIGVIAMALKYALDAAVVWLGTRELYPPTAFLRPLVGMAPGYPDTMPDAAVFGLMLVATVCFFIGLTASVRRAMDAGILPFWGFLFGVPVVRILAIVVLCVLPSRPRPAASADAPDRTQQARDTGLALLGAAATGLVATALLAQGLGVYGFALFSITPMTMGGLAGYLHNRHGARSVGSTLGVVLAALLVTALLLLSLALEGVVCILMAAPLALGVAVLAALVARAATIRVAPRPTSALALAFLPVFGLGADMTTENPVREVRTHVIVDAPPERVWPAVIAFPDLPPPRDVVRMSGLAYPVRARIVGEGVGAVRHCEFSTGPFVEPITRWEPPHRLSFDVTSQPMPMQETSPHGVIHPPHLDTMMRSRRGEFRLIPLPGGRTRLEGSTFYTLAAEPAWYWRPMADAIVHDIHRQVLEHVGRVATTR